MTVEELVALLSVFMDECSSEEYSLIFYYFFCELVGEFDEFGNMI